MCEAMADATDRALGVIGMPMAAFDPHADAYDRWYDAPEGRAILEAELACLRSLGGAAPGRWLEVGAGTGRFSAALGVAWGLDPSPRMLEIAARRGVRSVVGRAESLPFRTGAFDGILMVLALCFVSRPGTALDECRRVLRRSGSLLLGIVPADSHWGREYMDKSASGHAIYASAKFRTSAENLELVRDAGFAFSSAASTLFWRPGEIARAEARVEPGIVPGAGFVALRCVAGPPDRAR